MSIFHNANRKDTSAYPSKHGYYWYTLAWTHKAESKQALMPDNYSQITDTFQLIASHPTSHRYNNVPVLFPNPSSSSYGTSVTSRKLSASVLSPDPHTIPTFGDASFAGTRDLIVVCVVASISLKGLTDIVDLLWVKVLSVYVCR